MIRAVAILLIALPASADERLLDCRGIESAEQRLACYDSTIDALYAVESRKPADVSPNEPAVAYSAKVTSESPAGIDAEQEPEDQFGKPEPRVELNNAIDATVTAVSRTSHKKLLITLDNQQIWQQLDSLTMRLQVGDEINVRSARLNSYLLRKRSGGRSIRVKRIQ